MSRRIISDQVIEFDPALVSRLSAEAKELMSQAPDENRQLIIRALRRAWNTALSPIQRSYLQEYYVNCKTMKQIAELYSVNIGTVSRTLSRGRNRLRETLNYFL